MKGTIRMSRSFFCFASFAARRAASEGFLAI
jgi:hypothetical protein